MYRDCSVSAQSYSFPDHTMQPHYRIYCMLWCVWWQIKWLGRKRENYFLPFCKPSAHKWVSLDLGLLGPDLADTSPRRHGGIATAYWEGLPPLSPPKCCQPFPGSDCSALDTDTSESEGHLCFSGTICHECSYVICSTCIQRWAEMVS